MCSPAQRTKKAVGLPGAIPGRQQYAGAAQCPRQQKGIGTTVALLTTRMPILCCNGANTLNKLLQGSVR